MGADVREEAQPYEWPECWRLTREQRLNGTPEDFARWRAEVALVEEHNDIELGARREAWHKIKALIAQVWRRGSDESKAINKALDKVGIQCPPSFGQALSELERDAARRREEASRKTTLDAEVVRKLLAVGAFLAARGKKLGADYEPGTAIETANKIAREEAIAEEKTKGAFIPFGGDDYCENCVGWDMESGRCACGNCRVGWESDGDFEDMHVYAQAH